MNYLIKSISSINNLNFSLFNKFKVKKISKLTNNDEIKRSILGELLLIDGLKLFYNLDYNDTIFKINKYGKPYIKNNPLFFNISHSNDYSICAFSNNKIGVDIEKIKEVDLKIMNMFASDHEVKYILKEEREAFKRFFEIYTLKEAYFKMKGSNLSNMKNISFKIYDNKVVCSDGSVSASLSYEIKDYVIAFCQKKST